MRAIGFRASPTGVTFAIVEGEAAPDASTFRVLSVDVVPIPAALWPPNQLHFVRTVLLDVIEEFSVERAGLRLTEFIAGKSYPFRDNIEGVIQELLASSAVAWYVAGRNATLGAKLGLEDKTLFKRYCEGDATPDFVDDWASLKDADREAVLAAVAALRGGPPAPVAAPPAGAVADAATEGAGL